jgi:hypothetical protein
VLDFEVLDDGSRVGKAHFAWGSDAKSDAALDKVLQLVHLEDLRLLQAAIQEFARLDAAMAGAPAGFDLFAACSETTQALMAGRPKLRCVKPLLSIRSADRSAVRKRQLRRREHGSLSTCRISCFRAHPSRSPFPPTCCSILKKPMLKPHTKPVC